MTKILVVDNKILHHSYVNSVLLNRNYNVRIVFEMKDALSECNKNIYDIIIVDENMILHEPDFTKKILSIKPDIKIILIAGNRPLSNIIESAKQNSEEDTIAFKDDEIIRDMETFSIGVSGDSADYNKNKEKLVRNFEIKFISKYLKINKGNVAATARTINFHPVSLRQKIAKLGIKPLELKSN